MKVEVFDQRACLLGEGPLWHPLREQFFWFDVFGKKLLSKESSRGNFDGAPLEWQFDEFVSAAGWIDKDHLLIASESGLNRFHIESGKSEQIIPLEADNPNTRSNDGRADPMGGFWIGTMGKNAEPKAGAIYRYFQAELRLIYPGLTIPNSICFSPDGRFVYHTDNGPNHIIFKQALDESGWPVGEPEVFVDLKADALVPDGSVVDLEGALWNAQWGSSRVARYFADGRFDQAVEVGGLHSSCPAFGGQDMRTLLVTSACAYIEQPGEQDGMTFILRDSPFQGIPEPAVTTI